MFPDSILSRNALTLAALGALVLAWAVRHVPTLSRSHRNPLRKVAGPPVRGLFGSHMAVVLEYVLASVSFARVYHHSTVRLGPPKHTPSMLRDMVGMCV